MSIINAAHPRKKLPTLLLTFVPKEGVDDDNKNTILQQNNLTHLEDSTLHTKFTKRTLKTQGMWSSKLAQTCGGNYSLSTNLKSNAAYAKSKTSSLPQDASNA